MLDWSIRLICGDLSAALLSNTHKKLRWATIRKQRAVRDDGHPWAGPGSHHNTDVWNRNWNSSCWSQLDFRHHKTWVFFRRQIPCYWFIERLGLRLGSRWSHLPLNASNHLVDEQLCRFLVQLSDIPAWLLKPSWFCSCTAIVAKSDIRYQLTIALFRQQHKPLTLLGVCKPQKTDIA